MDGRRVHFVQEKGNHFQKERNHHPYKKQHTLEFKQVYKRKTIKDEFGCSTREPHQSSSRRRENDIQLHRTSKGDNSDLKTHLLKMIVMDLQSPRLVEDDGFKYFMKSLNPSTDAALSASAIRQELMNMYDITKKKVRTEVINAKDPVLSAELWMSSIKESYLTVTCHFIDKKWKLKSYTLDTAQLLGEHTPETIHRQLLRISTEWELMMKIQVVIVNVDKMKRVNSNSNWMYIPCFSHTLNKVIREVVDKPEWKYLMKKCRLIVQFFHQEKEDHQLAQSSCVDWLSTLNMIQKICDQWMHYSKVSSYIHEEDLWLNTNERMLLEHMKEAFTVVKNIIETIGKCGYVSVSNIIPLFDKLQMSLQRLQRDNKVAVRLREICKHHFEKIYLIDWFTVSTALDPRFKRSVLPGKGEEVKRKITEAMCKQASAAKMDYEDEFLQYAKEGDISANQNLLQYWAAKKKSEDLAVVAHKYLSVISTAIPIEQMMNEDKSQVICSRRKCLELRDISMMLFLNGNYQTYE